MASSLIPEKTLTVSADLAATIGLEEALLLGVLHDIALCQASPDWTTATPDLLARLLPFWQPSEVGNISQRMADQGILRIDGPPFDGRSALRYRLDMLDNPAPAMPPAAGRHAAVSKHGSMPANWQPSTDVCRQLKLQSIPQPFIDEQVPAFVLYWRERDSGFVPSWDARFYRHVVRAWREEEVRFPVKPELSPEPMHREWQPDPDALAILMQGGIPGDFIEESLPEFVLYWQERGDARNTWNSAFVQHVRRQWLRLNESMAHEKEPRVIPERWQPSDSVFEVLSMANIDLAFARERIAEFVMYWKETGKPHASWNSKFLRHVKYCWARKDQHSDKNYPEQFVDTYTDTSWADHL
jgi:hypothetical protein